MKKAAIIIVLILISLDYAQVKQVTNTGKYLVDFPHLAFNGSKVHLVYGTNFKYYNFNINGPASPIDNPVMPADNYGPNTTAIDVDPTDSNHLAIAYYDFHYDSNTKIQFYGCYVTESRDGGLTFDSPTLLDTVELGNTLSNLYYNMPQVKFTYDGTTSKMNILWEVHTNKVDTNALYLGERYGNKIRVDDSTKNSLEYAIGFTAEDKPAISYGVMDNGDVKFYLYTSGNKASMLVKNDGKTFLTSDNISRAFINSNGKIEYLFSDFAHNVKLLESEDGGTNWKDMGIIDNHPFRYVAFERINPINSNISGSYYVKLLADDNNNLVFWVSKDLIQWQSGGKVNGNSPSVYMGQTFVDLKLDDVNRYLLTAWIDSRTGNDEIFYNYVKLPELVGVKNEEKVIKNFRMEQNYPNPFNPSTVIKYSIPKTTFVSIKVYDILGGEVKTLLSEEKSAGNYNVTWYGLNNAGIKAPSGVYIYKLNAGNKVIVKKMMLLK